MQGNVLRGNDHHSAVRSSLGHCMAGMACVRTVGEDCKAMRMRAHVFLKAIVTQPVATNAVAGALALNPRLWRRRATPENIYSCFGHHDVIIGAHSRDISGKAICLPPSRDCKCRICHSPAEGSQRALRNTHSLWAWRWATHAKHHHARARRHHHAAEPYLSK